MGYRRQEKLGFSIFTWWIAVRECKLSVMKKLLLFFISLLYITVFSSQANAQSPDVVTNFSSNITINQDTSISIVETIKYKTSVAKRGIYRYIPVRYQRDGLSYTAKVGQVSVSDQTGDSVQFKRSSENGNVTLKIGDPDVTFTGEMTYILEYTVDNAVQRLEDYDELYWDITGEGWKIPIQSSTAVVSSTFANVSEVNCYTGAYGKNDGYCESEFTKKQAVFSYSRQIKYGDNFTVSVVLDQNNSTIVFPTAWQKFIKQLKDNYFLFFTLLPFLIMLAIWYKKGRDYVFSSPNIFNLDESQPKALRPAFHRHRTPFAYEPIKTLTAGEAGAILDGKVDNRDVVAEILELARKKYLKITPLEKKKWREQDFLFTKLKELDDQLPEYQRYLMESIFESKDEKKLSKLKGRFHTKMDKTKKLINESITAKKLFVENPQKTRLKYTVLVFILSAIGFVFVVNALNLTGSVWVLPCYGVQFVGGLMLAFRMPQKTAVGTNLMLQAKGLKHTIKRGKWREEIKEKHLFIEEILPFAVSFGVVNKLAKDMDALNIEPPSYLAGYAASQMSFGSFVSSFSSQVSSGLSYNPSSSGWSGSGGGGGGFSGGGGGGGGGGSW